MSKSIHEAARDIPVLEEAGVLVVGGGVAGCAAAYGAGKAGAKTILLERNGCLGGVATASLMANVGNRYITANQEQVVFGFAGDVLDRLAERGGASLHWKHRDVPGCVIDSELLKVVLIEMLEEAGVTTLTHAVGARPVMDGTAVKGAFIESKSGRQAVMAGNTVDCTGEADIAWQAGAETAWKGGSSSTLFKLANVDAGRFVEFLNEDPEGFPANKDWVKDIETFTKNWIERGILFFPHGAGRTWRFLQDLIASGAYETKIGPAYSLEALGMYALAGSDTIVINSNFYKIEDLDVRKLSEFELHAQKMSYTVADKLKEHVPGFEKSIVAHVGVDLGIRSSRYIVGRETLHRDALVDPEGPTFVDTVIATTCVQDTERQCGEYMKPFTCDVPFGVTVPKGCENLLVGSAKSISTEPAAAIRGMSGCMICGQAAGAAAALGAKTNAGAADVPIRNIQKELLVQGVRLGDEARLKELGLA